jgi:uncharacterized protein (TIGR00730 family)
MDKKTITVFSGLSKDNSEVGLTHCNRIGQIIAENGYTMVCAGASLGCQNQLVDGALSKQGKIIAVTVPMFESELRPELQLNKIVATGDDLSQRKHIMKNMADYGYVILPGGPGTLDELWEVISEKTENINNGRVKNIIIMNTNGFYNSVKEQLDIMNHTFNWNYSTGIQFIDNPDDLSRLLSPKLGGKSKKYRKGKSRKDKSKKNRGKSDCRR